MILQLVGVALKFGQQAHLYVGLLIGLFAGFATDFVIAAAGVRLGSNGLNLSISG